MLDVTMATKAMEVTLKEEIAVRITEISKLPGRVGGIMETSKLPEKIERVSTNAQPISQDAEPDQPESNAGEQETEPDILPEDFLTNEQIETIRSKYKKLGYSDEEIEAKVKEYALKAKICKEAEEKGLENLTETEKGNYGEMKTDLDMLDKGYVRISKDSVTSLNGGHTGIDGVYENPDGKPRYIIVESKYRDDGNGSLNPKPTTEGKQMDDNWTFGNNLDKAVGKDKADEIRLEKMTNPDNVGKTLATIDRDGNVKYESIDQNANIEKEKDVFK